MFSFKTLAVVAVILLIGLSILFYGSLLHRSAEPTPRFIEQPESLWQSGGKSYSLPSGSVGVHKLSLASGDGLDLYVRGEKTDIRLVLRAPDGHPLVSSDVVHRAWDREWIGWVAADPGLYRVEVHSVGPEPNRYWIESVNRLVVNRDEETRLRDRLLARRLMSEAANLRDPTPVTELSIEEATRKVVAGGSLLASTESPLQSMPVRLLLRALKVWESLPGEVYWEAETLLRLGIEYDDAQQYRQAVEYYSRAIDLLEETGEVRLLAKSLSLRGIARALLQNWRPAIDDLKRSLLLLGGLEEDPPLKAATRTVLGGALAGTLETEQSVSHLLMAVSEWQQAGDCWGEARAHLLLGQVYQSMGQTSLGDGHIQTANRLIASGCQPSGGVVPPQMRGWDKLAEATPGLRGHTRKRLLESLPLVEEGRDMFVRAGDRLGESLAGILVAAIELDLALHGSDDKETRAQRALRNARNSRLLLEEKLPEQLSARAGAESIEAACLGILDRNEEALGAYQRAFDLAASANDSSAIPPIELGRARVYRQLGLLDQSQASIESALNSLEKRRLDFSDSLLRASFFNTSRDYFDFYIELLMQERATSADSSDNLGRTALKASELARARVLRELIRSGQIVEAVSPETVPLRKERTDLEGEIGALLLILRQQVDPETRASLDSELATKMSALQELDFQIAGLQKSTVSELERPAALDVEEIRKLLSPQEAFLEYFLGQDRSYLFVVTAEQFGIHELPSGGVIKKQVAAMREAISRESVLLRPNYLQAARELYGELLGPAIGQLHGKRGLLIVPDDSLFALPFEALLSSGSLVDLERLPNSDLPFLVRDYWIRYAPSAGTLAVLARRARSERPLSRVFLGLAEPVSNESNRPGPELKRAPAGEVEAATADSEGGFDERRLGEYLKNLPPLEGTCRQVEAITGGLPKGTATVLCGPSASEQAFLQLDLSQYKYLHFAVHGLFVPSFPDYSSLVLSPVADVPLSPSNRTTQDGLLTVREIYRLHLSSELVSLPACETGLGSVLRGEGVMGMSRAFMFAGTRSVLVSLWKVWKDSTGDLMISFYRHLLLAAEDKPEALRQAQLEMISSGRSHPFYWAAFVLIGEK